MAKKKGTIFFDFDGTLHETMKIYGPALDIARKFLIENNVEFHGLTPELYHTYLGYNADEMWEDVLRDANFDLAQKVKMMVGRAMDENLENGVGRLYPNTESTLGELKNRGYTLIYISNARNSYYEKVKKIYKLDRFFERFLTSQMYNEIPKEEIISQVKNEFPAPFSIVGDRFFDMVAGKKNGIKTVFCSYGYGEKKEGEEADFKIDSIEELLDIF